jgi:predicted DNA-binding protein (UPF0251 family)
MKPRTIRGVPQVTRFTPVLSEGKARESGNEPVTMTYDEFEALRLVDYEGLLQEEASQHMGVSRGTVWRCLDSGRRKVAKMIVEGRELHIVGGSESSDQDYLAHDDGSPRT